MDVPLGGHRADYRSVKDFVDLLARAYFLLVVYFWKAGSDTHDLSKDKKIYFGDPLLHTVTLDAVPFPLVEDRLRGHQVRLSKAEVWIPASLLLWALG